MAFPKGYLCKRMRKRSRKRRAARRAAKRLHPNRRKRMRKSFTRSSLLGKLSYHGKTPQNYVKCPKRFRLKVRKALGDELGGRWLSDESNPIEWGITGYDATDKVPLIGVSTNLLYNIPVREEPTYVGKDRMNLNLQKPLKVKGIRLTCHLQYMSALTGGAIADNPGSDAGTGVRHFELMLLRHKDSESFPTQAEIDADPDGYSTRMTPKEPWCFTKHQYIEESTGGDQIYFGTLDTTTNKYQRFRNRKLVKPVWSRQIIIDPSKIPSKMVTIDGGEAVYDTVKRDVGGTIILDFYIPWYKCEFDTPSGAAGYKVTEAVTNLAQLVVTDFSYMHHQPIRSSTTQVAKETNTPLYVFGAKPADMTEFKMGTTYDTNTADKCHLEFATTVYWENHVV